MMSRYLAFSRVEPRIGDNNCNFIQDAIIMRRII